MYPSSPIINVMQKAAYAAAKHLRRDFGEVEDLQVSRKGPADFVSKADHRSEKIIREHLRKARPDFAILAEESGHHPSDSPDLWIIDPLDGTTNFLHGFPHFAITIAHHHNGAGQAGIIYDVLRDEMFYADKSQGAFVNNRKLRVSNRQQINQALLSTGIRCQKSGQINDAMLGQLQRVLPHCVGLRRCGSAALDLAWVAAGRHDGFWETGLKLWDVAAGTIIVREAGGQVSGLSPLVEPLKDQSILATNRHIHTDLAALLKP